MLLPSYLVVSSVNFCCFQHNNFFTPFFMQELPTFILPILQTHKAKWAEDISKATSRLNKLHAKRMNEFAQDVIAATKNHTPLTPTYSSPPRVVEDSSNENAQENGTNGTPNTKFWQEATAYADEVEKSARKLLPHNNLDVASTSAPATKESTEEDKAEDSCIARRSEFQFSTAWSNLDPSMVRTCSVVTADTNSRCCYYSWTILNSRSVHRMPLPT